MGLKVHLGLCCGVVQGPTNDGLGWPDIGFERSFFMDFEKFNNQY